jgi:hypothetical protein
MSEHPECVHLPDYAGETCAGCGEEIDQYGNTANDFNACSFPDCGCDGARLCMAGSASDDALSYNVEGMYSSRDPRARMRFVGAVYEGKFASVDRSGEAGETRSGSTVGESAVRDSGDAQTPSSTGAGQ